MARCCSFTASRDWCFRYSFSRTGLKSTTVNLHDGATVIHIWIPKSYKPNKPSLLLIHGFGANAMWQYNDFVSPLVSKFNVYIPDLLFFGDSYTTRPDRTEQFQAECVMAALEDVGVVGKIHVMGLSYGGFVGYCMAVQYPEKVDKVVIAASGVCFDESDMETGLLSVKNIEDAISILLAQTPEKLRELMQMAFFKPPQNVPSCFLSDFIDVMNTEHVQEKRELIETLHKGRKVSNLPKITQPTLIIWGEHDQIFPLELGHRLKRHLGENAELVIIKNSGHAINAEKPKELYKNMKSFLTDHK
ncbi:putative triacylglycerol lipase [Helianthus annuus]|uniref:Putative alpha/beta-Hydrolases superfamily protein n=1 Tax=Helianthus annuus TaxID=4232 RepID=A0A251S6A2_HELAN|nr:lipase 1 [Helianthus annuus]KAF5763252.1 putative triacylglycerol lipase [Helianthus annuus]KAJ0471935.1 putative triacylglycerol lipase [Helianthus annuus]KAJ0651416.1 putative triacylglycerol lipase [Helianthus annuus]KAJ0829993.1 putative triacylglycerol lipase [Helianthus annuus]KAJ0843355.1 putative triacylglycerol lipase [Helianthus annuus]